MQLTTSEVIEAIRTLPSSEREKIRRTLETEKQTQDARVQEEIGQYMLSRKWIEEHKEEFLGQWVCLEGDKLIASGSDALEVNKRAREAGIESPFIVQIIDEPKNFTGAWL